MISDELKLIGATTKYGNAIPVYDDGSGSLYISRDSTGINGIVRANSWENAYEICEDEFFPEADETMEEIIRDYGFQREDIRIVKIGGVEREARAEDFPLEPGQFVRWETRETPDAEAWSENALFCEAFGFRPSGPNATDTLCHGLYRRDLNGDYLDELTPALLAELEITLQTEAW